MKFGKPIPDWPRAMESFRSSFVWSFSLYFLLSRSPNRGGSIMRTYFSILPLLYFFLLTSCSDEKTKKGKDVGKDNFFDTQTTDDANDFKNEMATGESRFSDASLLTGDG